MALSTDQSNGTPSCKESLYAAKHEQKRGTISIYLESRYDYQSPVMGSDVSLVMCYSVSSKQ